MMGIGDKLDEIIGLLKSIDAKLSGANDNAVTETKATIEQLEMPMEKPTKPTSKQRQCIRAFELGNRLDRKRFLTNIRKDIAGIMERQKIEPNRFPVFTPQSLAMLSKVPGRNAPAYREFAERTRLFADAVTKEGASLIIRLTKKLKDNTL